jgi:hypothetical protein
MSEELNSQSDMMMQNIAYFKLKQDNTSRKPQKQESKRVSLGITNIPKVERKAIAHNPQPLKDQEGDDFEEF